MSSMVITILSWLVIDKGAIEAADLLHLPKLVNVLLQQVGVKRNDLDAYAVAAAHHVFLVAGAP